MTPRIELVGGPLCGMVVDSPTTEPPATLRRAHRVGGEVCRYQASPWFDSDRSVPRPFRRQAGYVDYVYQFLGHGREARP